MTRTTYKLSQEGLQEIEEKRRLKGWGRTSERWAEVAMSSESTLKRFLKGEAISAVHFINLCQAIGIEDWQSLVEWKSSDGDSVKKYSLTVTGIFTEDQKLQIEGLLDALKNLLSNAQIVFKPPDDINKSNDD